MHHHAWLEIHFVCVHWCVWRQENVASVFPGHSTLFLEAGFSMINKNPETEIGVQPKNQKSKAAKPLEKSYLYQGWVTAD